MGIVYLIIATVCAAMFSILFKIFHIKGINSNQAIFINYVTAFLYGVVFSLHGDMVVNPFTSFWFVPVIILGAIFIIGMVVLSYSTQCVGVAISTVCSRASMVIPIIISFLFIDGSDKPKWWAIALLLIAMSLSVWTDTNTTGQYSWVKKVVASLSVFVLFGLSNAGLKVLQYKIGIARTGLSEQAVNSELSLVTAIIFLSASIFGTYYLFKKDSDGHRSPLTLKTIVGGIALGTVNYFCTYLLMLSMKSLDAALLFPIHNVGIVAIGVLVGRYVFKEQLRKHQIVGLVIAMVTIFYLCL